jgi:putative DNA primase/helicase
MTPEEIAALTGVVLEEPEPTDGPTSLTELGNARRLVASSGRDIRHCSALPGDGWIVWEGSRWSVDHTGVVMRRVKALSAELRIEADQHLARAEAATEKAEHERLRAVAKAKNKWADRCESATTIGATAKLLKTEAAIPVLARDLDADPWLMGTPGDTIDLRTCQTRPANRSDLITRSTRVAPSEEDCPMWRSFLWDAMEGDMGVIDFLQLLAGYSLVGVTDEQIMVICAGRGRNGKSVMLEVLRHVMGDYAKTAPASSFVGRKDGAIPNDIAALAGARFVTASETEENQRIDEVLVKSVTGGDSITARFLNREFFEFKPQFTLWMATNHKPRIKGTDLGIWRRLIVVPFKRTIEREAVDKGLTARLIEQEGPQILGWMLAGLKRWNETRHKALKIPEALQLAADEYQQEEDAVAQFLDSECEIGPAFDVTSRELYEAFSAWCQREGEFKRSSKWLGVQLKAHGYKQIRDSRTRSWGGLRLVETKGRRWSP